MFAADVSAGLVIRTEPLSTLSDRICLPIVLLTASRYSRVLGTPSHFVEMLLLVEDKRFPVHFGLDPIAIIRALVFNLRGCVIQGGSTIAQQVYTIRQWRSLGRARPKTLRIKFRQAVWAIMHSLANSKKCILTEYVDNVYWGRSYRGLDSAAFGYFRRGRSELSVAQSFFLAERIAAPNRVSVKRISNLLRRWAISENLRNRGIRCDEIIELYDIVYGCGGELWRTLAK
jgi:membrane peptidoglycan carboxypeptidase